MERIAALIVKHHKRVLGLTGLITLLAVVALFRISFNADVTQFMTEGNEVGRDFVELQEKYDTGDPVNVLVSLPEGRTFRDADALVELIGLRDAISKLEGVGGVATIVPQTDPLTGATLTADAVAALPPAALEKAVFAGPIAGLLLSEDGRSTLTLVVPEGDATGLARDLARFVEAYPPDGLELTLTGNPVIFARVIDMITWFLLVIPPVVMGLLLLTFYVTIGDRKLTVMAIVPAALASVWTFGLLSGLGIRIDIVSVIVPIFVIVMGSADGLHFVTHYQEEARRTDDKVERVTTTLRDIGVPMILTTVSTAAGFLSLLATGVGPMQQMGVFAAVGIVFAGVISFFFLPALLSRAEITSKPSGALLGPRLTGAVKALARRRWVAAVLTVGLLAFAAFSIPRIAVDTDQLFFFKDDDPVRADFAKMEEVFGGATPLMGEFVLDPAAGLGQLPGILEVSRELESLPGVRRVFSAADLLADVPPAELPGVVAGLASGTTVSPLGRMVSSDGLRFVLFPSDFTTADLRGWLDFAATQPEIRTLTGMTVLWDEMARLVLRAQGRSLLAAFALVIVMLLIAYRRVRLTLVALVPLVLTILTLLGFLADSGIQLNLLTAIASSIVLGVGIDYSIHFVAAIERARADGPGYVLRAIDKAGRPIIANALGIAIGLTALWLSPLKYHGQVSMIMWVSMTTAALTALLVIPALTGRDGMRQPD
ncbi:MAG: MMPL family transporter [Actinobacteria bacterium]|nr:MMPL family transporter [Actinomycetota bacterium]